MSQWLRFLALGTALLAVACTEEELPTLTSPHTASQPVVYGVDGREDYYVYGDRVWADRVLGFSVALIWSGWVDTSNPDDVFIDGFGYGSAYNLCPGTRFADQQISAGCSGTLIAPDLVLTAGHCVANQSECDNTKFVFDFAMTDASSRMTVTADDVYSCGALLVTHSGAPDYAVVRLDRQVVGRAPAKLRFDTGPVANGDWLLAAGYPAGLPLKLLGNGWVRDNRPTELEQFIATLDTFGGNSGSGVFLASTRELAGILFGGETDYVNTGGCGIVNVCPETGCAGEGVTYVAQAIDALCAVDNADLCQCGNGSCDNLIGETTESCPLDCGSSCGDGACNGSETPLTCAADCGTCPNGVCDADEALDGSCCTDCGCSGGDLCVYNGCLPDPVPGDRCDNATSIPAALTQTLQGSTSSYADDFQGSCGGGSPDRVYTFAIDTLSNVVAEVSGYDTVLYARTDCADSATELGCNDDNDPSGAPGSHVELLGIDPGTYFLFVDGSGTTTVGDFTLTVTFDGCPSDPAKDEPGACGCGVADIDTDLDQTFDCNDGCPDDAGKTEPGVCGCGVADVDTDSDLSADCIDGCPTDPDKIATGICGCGVADTDTDSDLIADCNDGCPDDAGKTEPGVCGCGVADVDTDSDLTADCIDGCPNDAGKTAPGVRGCGVSDVDGDTGVGGVGRARGCSGVGTGHWSAIWILAGSLAIRRRQRAG